MQNINLHNNSVSFWYISDCREELWVHCAPSVRLQILKVQENDFFLTFHLLFLKNISGVLCLWYFLEDSDDREDFYNIETQEDLEGVHVVKSRGDHSVYQRIIEDAKK